MEPMSTSYPFLFDAATIQQPVPASQWSYVTPLRVCQAQQDSRRRLPALWAVEGCAVEVLLHHLLPSLLLLLTVASGCTWRECWQFCRSWSCSFSCCWSIFRRNADFLRCLGCRDRCMLCVCLCPCLCVWMSISCGCPCVLLSVYTVFVCILYDGRHVTFI